MKVLYGINPIREALLSHRSILDSVYLMRKSNVSRLLEIKQLAKRRAIPVHQVGEDLLSRMANTSQHQGVVAKVGEFCYGSYEDIVNQVAEPGLILVLDGIEDPQNLGAILRSAEGAGVSGIFIQDRRSASITPAVAKASAGATAHLRISRQKNLSRVLTQLKEDGYWVVGLDATAPDRWTQPDYRVATVLVLGSEDRGIRLLVRSHCDYLVSLPMRGRVESLNVSVSAGIVLYEVLRQRNIDSTLETPSTFWK